MRAKGKYSITTVTTSHCMRSSPAGYGHSRFTVPVLYALGQAHPPTSSSPLLLDACLGRQGKVTETERPIQSTKPITATKHRRKTLKRAIIGQLPAERHAQASDTSQRNPAPDEPGHEQTASAPKATRTHCPLLGSEQNTDHAPEIQRSRRTLPPHPHTGLGSMSSRR